MNSSRIAPALKASASGFLATFPMTVFMEALFRKLPRHERYPLPPRETTDALASKALSTPLTSSSTMVKAAMINHFAYGAAMGTTLPLALRALPRDFPLPLKGATFGTAVWLVSYLSLLPALNILKPATEHPMRRNYLMNAAHWIWGASAALIYRNLQSCQSLGKIGSPRIICGAA